MSVLLDDQVSKAMLDAWSAPGKDAHNISWSRLRALILVTNRFDLLDRDLRELGAAVLVGEEIHTARLGHLKTKIAELTADLSAVERMAAPIDRGGEGCRCRTRQGLRRANWGHYNVMGVHARRRSGATVDWKR